MEVMNKILGRLKMKNIIITVILGTSLTLTGCFSDDKQLPKSGLTNVVCQDNDSLFKFEIIFNIDKGTAFETLLVRNNGDKVGGEVGTSSLNLTEFPNSLKFSQVDSMGSSVRIIDRSNLNYSRKATIDAYGIKKSINTIGRCEIKEVTSNKLI